MNPETTEAPETPVEVPETQGYTQNQKASEQDAVPPKSIPTYSFGVAINIIKEGRSCSRLGWNGRHKISLQNPGELSKMTESYIYITTERGDIIPWVASHADMLENDWFEA